MLLLFDRQKVVLTKAIQGARKTVSTSKSNRNFKTICMYVFIDWWRKCGPPNAGEMAKARDFQSPNKFRMAAIFNSLDSAIWQARGDRTKNNDHSKNSSWPEEKNRRQWNGEGLTVALKFRTNETKMEYHSAFKINLKQINLQELKRHITHKSNYSPFFHPHFAAHRFFDTFFSLLYPCLKKWPGTAKIKAHISSTRGQWRVTPLRPGMPLLIYKLCFIAPNRLNGLAMTTTLAKVATPEEKGRNGMLCGVHWH